MRASDRVIDRNMGYQELKDRLRLLGEPKVIVGIRQEHGQKIANEDDEESELTLAEVASVNEFGSEGGHIPERSFMRSTFDENVKKYGKALEKGLKEALDDDFDVLHIRNALGRVGLRVTRDIQRKIRALREPPNAPRTIAEKGSDNPLIDTGRMRQSIDHEIIE